jgi:hypothetical protein
MQLGNEKPTVLPTPGRTFQEWFTEKIRPVRIWPYNNFTLVFFCKEKEACDLREWKRYKKYSGIHPFRE